MTALHALLVTLVGGAGAIWAVFWKFYMPKEPIIPNPIPPMPTPTPVPVLAKPSPSMLWRFSDAVATYEGGHTIGNLAYRNNNPLDYRWPWGGKLPAYALRVDAKNFLIFDTWDHGFAYGMQNIENACTGKSEIYHPTDTIAQFFAKFAPSSDDNDPDRYAAWVAQRIGLSTTTPISVLMG